MFALVKKNTAHVTQVEVCESLAEAQDKKKGYSKSSHQSEIIKVENLKVLTDYAEYDEDIEVAVVEVSAELNGNPICVEFNVGLSGGEYLPQMGCCITTGGDDGEFDEQERILYEAVMKCDDCPGIAETAEKAYDYYLKEHVLDDGGDWEEVQGWAKPHETYIPVCATAHAEWILEEDKKYNEDENGCYETFRYRLRIEKSGHISQNDYAMFPDFTVEYFDSIEDAKKRIKED